MWKLVNSNFSILVLGFVLTTVVGTYLSDQFQRDSLRYQIRLEENKQKLQWTREKKFELFRQRITEGGKSIEEISDLINSRVFHLQNAIVSIFSNNLKSAQIHWGKNKIATETWNIKLIGFQNRLKRVVSAQAATSFNGYTTDRYPDLKVKEFEQFGPDEKFLILPQDVHAHFWIVHRIAQDAINCMKKKNCKVSRSRKKALQKRLAGLDYFTDEFVDSISNKLVQKTIRLEEFVDFR